MQPPSQPRRSRRERTRIELSADQPPTTQGQRRTRVYVACVQWYAPLQATILSLQLSLVGGARSVVTGQTLCKTSGT
ncbi:hypothetical protein EI94DRAFT_1720097 [Lactarius quietus]|nr:hypothetical protein EI94DRAFT_1720097 [Lactarius quietus]